MSKLYSQSVAPKSQTCANLGRLVDLHSLKHTHACGPEISGSLSCQGFRHMLEFIRNRSLLAALIPGQHTDTRLMLWPRVT